MQIDGPKAPLHRDLHDLGATQVCTNCFNSRPLWAVPWVDWPGCTALRHNEKGTPSGVPSVATWDSDLLRAVVVVSAERNCQTQRGDQVVLELVTAAEVPVVHVVLEIQSERGGIVLPQAEPEPRADVG